MAFWVRTKTNRLKLPPTFKRVDRQGETHTWCGQPLPRVGDYVHVGSGVSAGTVGKVINIKTFKFSGQDGMISIDVETLAGKIQQGWAIGSTVIDYAAVQEVKDFYIADGRPDRIQVPW